MKHSEKCEKSFSLLRLIIFIIFFQIVNQALPIECQSAQLDFIGGKLQIKLFAYEEVKGEFESATFTYDPYPFYGIDYSFSRHHLLSLEEDRYTGPAGTEIDVSTSLRLSSSVHPSSYSSSALLKMDAYASGFRESGKAECWIEIEIVEPITFLIAAERGEKIGDSGFIYFSKDTFLNPRRDSAYGEIGPTEFRKNNELIGLAPSISSYYGHVGSNEFELGVNVEIGDIISIAKTKSLIGDHGSYGYSFQDFYDDTAIYITFPTPPPVPIPGTGLLLGAGLGCLAIYRRRKLTARN